MRDRFAAECIGTALLVVAVVGSGIMGTLLSEDLGVVLLINAVSTILALGLLIVMLMPASGAHLNPVVSLAALLRGELSARHFLGYAVAQLSGACIGVIIANMMFDLPAVALSANDRVTSGTLIGEVIATAGLIALILVFSDRGKSPLLVIAVPAWIGSAYFFTSSTSFANPAVTFGRMFTDTFTGIAPTSVLPFVAAQLVGMALGLLAARSLRQRHTSTPSPANDSQETNV